MNNLGSRAVGGDQGDHVSYITTVCSYHCSVSIVVDLLYLHCRSSTDFILVDFCFLVLSFLTPYGWLSLAPFNHILIRSASVV